MTAWRRRHTATNRAAVDGDLREFVYLDDTSVYSLLASRRGPVAVKFDDTTSDAVKTEAGGGLTVTVGPAKADGKSRRERTRTSTQQVSRQASAQARFKELLDTEESQLTLRERPPAAQPDVDHFTALDDATSPRNPWVVEADDLRRGELVEIEVVLDADDVYKAAETVQAVLDIVQDDPEALGFGSPDEIRQGVAISRVFDQLLGGLVPIRATAVHYEVVPNDGRPLIVHTRVLDRLADRPATQPLELVAVAETELFWKDTRRVLFAGNRYRVMARVARSGLVDTWAPIKLKDVLATVSKEIATGIDALTEGFLPAVRGAVDDDGSDQIAQIFNAALGAYAEDLSAAYSVSVDDGELEATGALVGLGEAAPTSVPEQRKRFAAVTALVAERAGQSVDPVCAAELRGAAYEEAQLLFLSNRAAQADPGDAGGDSGRESEPNLLEVELIAAYW